jgi:hypothetical protein
MSEDKNHIKHYSAAEIQNYVEGNLSAEEMHAIEKAALDDPFLADALEGFENTIKQNENNNLTADINELKKRLQHRTDDKRKIVALSSNHLWWRIAAAIIVLLGVGILSYNYLAKNNGQTQNIAQQKERTSNADTILQKNNRSPVQPKADSAINNDVAVNKKENVSTVQTRRRKKNHSYKITDQKKTSDKDISNATADVASSIVKAEIKAAIKKDTEDLLKSIPKGISISGSGNIFTGKVIDENSHPVSGATVAIRNQKNATITDNNGFFKLNSSKPDSIIKITVNSVGFEPAEATIISENDVENNTINLRQRSSSLNEIVVSGYGTKKKSAKKQADILVKDAEPVIGFIKYKEYLDSNKRLPADSTGIRIIETVSFTIKKDGKLSNFNTERPYNDDYDAEAIRLIKDGPAWKLLKGKKTKATITIEF